MDISNGNLLGKVLLGKNYEACKACLWNSFPGSATEKIFWRIHGKLMEISLKAAQIKNISLNSMGLEPNREPSCSHRIRVT